MNCAINYENLRIVKYLVSKGHCWKSDACDHIAETGNVEILAYALATGCVLNGTEAAAAARHGHLPLLKYLHEVHQCQWDEDTTYNAAVGGNLDCLIYAHEQGCPWNTREEDVGMSLAELCRYNVCTTAAVNDDVECLQYAHSRGVPFIPNLLHFTYVFHNSNTKCFEYARQQGAAWTSGLYERAIVYNNFTLLQYLCENGCPFDGTNDCTIAAEYNRLQHLEYLHTKGCPWDAETCAVAVEMNHTDILLYLLRNGCPVWPHLWVPLRTYCSAF